MMRIGGDIHRESEQKRLTTDERESVPHELHRRGRPFDELRAGFAVHLKVFGNVRS